MNNDPRRFPAVAAVLLLSIVVLPGCAGGEPPEVAATIGRRTIARPLVESWRRLESSIRERSGLPSISSDEGRAAALEGLIRAEWVRMEASSRGISLERAQRKAGISSLGKRLGMTSETLREIGASARLSWRQLKGRAWADSLEEVLVRRDLLASPALSNATLLRYYRRHVPELGEPEKRTFVFIVAASEDEVKRAELAAEQGTSWRRLAARYSIPAVLRELGWRLADITRGELRILLNEEAAHRGFGAQPHQIVGPFLLKGFWMFFEVTDVEPAFRPTFHLAREAVRNRLLQRRRHAAEASFEQILQVKYRDLTRCASDYGIPWCRSLPADR